MNTNQEQCEMYMTKLTQNVHHFTYSVKAMSKSVATAIATIMATAGHGYG